jgi:hypothetical protein
VQLQVMVLVQLSLICPHLLPTSAHVNGLHPQTPLVHGPFAQSVSPPHAFPGAHVGPQFPPQSMSVSAPFLIVSLQVAGWHLRFRHTLLPQSDAPLHAFPSPHFGHCGPPQSTSLSWPSFAEFVHDAGPPSAPFGVQVEPERVNPELQPKSHCVPLHVGKPSATVGHPVQPVASHPIAGFGAAQMPPHCFSPALHVGAPPAPPLAPPLPDTPPPPSGLLPPPAPPIAPPPVPPWAAPPELEMPPVPTRPPVPVPNPPVPVPLPPLPNPPVEVIEASGSAPNPPKPELPGSFKLSPVAHPTAITTPQERPTNLKNRIGAAYHPAGRPATRSPAKYAERHEQTAKRGRLPQEAPTT